MTARIEPSLLGKMSQQQVLRALQARGPLSRAEVARHTGLSAPAVSRAVTALLQTGLVEETAQAQPTGGRPATQLRLARQASQVIGVSIDAGHCSLVSAGLDGELHEQGRTIRTPRTYARLVEALATESRALMSRPGVTTLGIGLSVPGLIDSRELRTLLSPNVPITDGHTPSLDLAAELGIECILLQESHALCLAELHHGKAVGLADFAMLDMHTGVGLGVVCGGRLLTGHTGLAGELGHITVVPGGRPCGCGNRGCLETMASDTSLAWRISRKLGRDLDLDEILTLSRSGKLDLREELEDLCNYLAIALAAVLNLFNPARLFVHGRAFETDPDLFTRLIERTRCRALGPNFACCSILRATAQKPQGAIAGIIQHLTFPHAPSPLPTPLSSPSEVRHAVHSP